MKPYVLIEIQGAEVTSGPSGNPWGASGQRDIAKVEAHHGALIRVRDVSAVRLGDTDQTVDKPGMYRVNVIHYPSAHRKGLVKLEVA